MVLDCLGQRCPLPVIALARAVTTVEIGAEVQILADDPAAAGDIAAWCRMRGQRLENSPTPHTFTIRRLH